MKERIQLLIDALRSGKFTQSQGNLRDAKGYCCLGVACEVYRQQTGEGTWRPTHTMFGEGTWRPTHTMFEFDSGTQTCSGYMPNRVWKWFGFDASNPHLMTSGTPTSGPRTTSATYMNDHSGADFPAIADAFERTYITNVPQTK